MSKKNNNDKNKFLSDPWNDYPALRWTAYIAAGVTVVWASQYVFKAFAGSITAFKELKQAVKA